MPPFYFFFFICWQQLCPKQINIVVHRMKLFLGSNLELKLLSKWFSSRFWVHIQEPFFLFISSHFTRHKKKVGEKTTFLTFTYGGNFSNKKKRSIRPLDKTKKNKERNSYSVHETGKKVFFSNTHGFAEVPLDTIFNVFFLPMVPSERFSVEG